MDGPAMDVEMKDAESVEKENAVAAAAEEHMDSKNESSGDAEINSAATAAVEADSQQKAVAVPIPSSSDNTTNKESTPPQVSSIVAPTAQIESPVVPTTTQVKPVEEKPIEQTVVKPVEDEKEEGELSDGPNE